MQDFTWVWALVWALIPVTFIVTWGIRRVVPSTRGISKKQLEEVRAQVGELETRLAAVEKVLNDIP